MARPNNSMTASSEIVELIKEFEKDAKTGGPVLVAEPCVAGKPTAGWGATTYLDASGVRQPVVTGMEFTADECENMLLADIDRHAQIIRRRVPVYLSQSEFDCLVSLAFNVREFEARFVKSRTLANLIEMKRSVEKTDVERYRKEFIKEFLDWDKATVGGEVVRLRGLYRRRCAEALHMMGLPWREATCSSSIALDMSFEDIQTRAMNINEEKALEGMETPKAVSSKQEGPTVFDPRPVQKPKKQPKPVSPRPPSVNTAPIDYDDGIDPLAGTKPLSESDRGRGFAAKVSGVWTGLVGALPAVGGLVSDTYVAAIQPFMAGILMFAGVMIVLGLILYLFGDYLEKKGRAMASQYLR